MANRYYVYSFLSRNHIVEDITKVPIIYHNNKWAEIDYAIDEADLQFYDIIDDTVVFNHVKFKQEKMTELRTIRKILFEQLDALYFAESEKIYLAETFQRTPEMDSIMAKKKILRGLPQRLDPLNSKDEISAFVIPQTLDEIV